MIILRHNKCGDMSFVSHKDTMKTIQRSLRRGEFKVNFSQGYIPHMLMYMSAPIPLGVQSVAEYCVVDCQDFDASDFLKRYNAASPTGIVADKSWYVIKNPNIAAVASASEYFVKVGGDIPKEIFGIMDRATYEVEFNKKEGLVTKDIRALIYDIKAVDGGLKVVLACGNENLRVDAFIASFKKNFGLKYSVNDIVRTAQFALKDEKFVNIEECFC